MDLEFWKQRWRDGLTGFHQEQVNDYLRDNWQALEPAAGDRVLVPLCGKSLDMLWLRQQGQHVIGVEISALAVEAFFSENKLPMSERRQVDDFEVLSAEGIDLYCGDFFQLKPDQLAGARLVYDRASLIALPPEMREQYAARLKGLLEPGSCVLLITMEYPQEQMDGPPFSVMPGEVEALYGDAFDITALDSRDILADNARFRERGLTQLLEKTWLMRKK